MISRISTEHRRSLVLGDKFKKFEDLGEVTNKDDVSVGKNEFCEGETRRRVRKDDYRERDNQVGEEVRRKRSEEL